MDREGEVDSINSPPPVPQSPIQVSTICTYRIGWKGGGRGREEGKGKLNKRWNSLKPPSLPRMEGVFPTWGIYSPDSTAKSCTVQENPVQYRFFKDILESK